MVYFNRDENKVVIKVEHGIFRGDGYFELTIEQSHNYQAELLRNAFQENLNRHLSKIKEDAYNQGWKEAKAKMRKRTNFYGGWKF